MKKLFMAAMAATTLFATSAIAGESRYDMSVSGMMCKACVKKAEGQLKDMDGVKSVSTDLDAGTVSVCAIGDVNFTDDQLKGLFSEKGFTYNSMTKHDKC